MKRIFITAASLLLAVSAWAERVKLDNVAKVLTDRAPAYIDVRHYAGTVYTQALAELYRATSDDFYSKRALEILQEFSRGSKEGYGSFLSYKVGGTAAPELAFMGFDAVRAQALSGAEDMFANQQRNDDGVMLPPWPDIRGKNAIFVDCVFAVTPYLLYSGLAFKRQEWVDYAAWMTLKTFEDLYDPDSGLLHQARAVRHLAPGQMTQDCWSRGNGWGAMALAALMRDLPADNEYYGKVCELARRYFAAVMKYQDDAGLWHQEMTWADSYPEISGSALLLYGLGTGIQKEVLPNTYMQAFKKGLSGLLTYIDKAGNVGNTCSGCLAYGDCTKAAYASHKFYCNEQHAFGPVLLSLSQALAMGMDEVDASLGSAIADITPRCHVRCIQERKRDVAWENDRVAYRVYSQLSPKDKISSGVDFWAKSVDYPIIERWYRKDAQGGSYHVDDGEGYDFYAVGKNRGLGGIGIWDGTSLIVPEPYIDCKIICDSPEYLEFSLTYPAVECGGQTVELIHKISMKLGAYFYKSEVTAKTSSGKSVVLAAGLTSFGNAQVSRDASRACLSLEEDISAKDGRIGSTVVARPENFAGFASDGKDELVLMNVGSGQTVTFYVAGAWSGDLRFDPFYKRWPRMMAEVDWYTLDKSYSVAKAGNTMIEDALAGAGELSEVFRTGAEWVPYPAYSDREAWKKLAGKRAGYILKMASKYDNYEWHPIPASTYLEYEKTGNRTLMKYEGRNRQCLNALVLAELVEGEGRYLSKIADFMWLETTRYSWAHAQHTARQTSRRTLPEPTDRYISLHSAENAVSLAYACHFFKEELDKMDPSICRVVRNSMRENIFEPFFDEAKHNSPEERFLGLGYEQTLLNNWNIYCNFGVLTAFLLMEDDQEELVRALKLSAKSVDAYLSYIADDGCCDEGPSYWRMSFGKIYEYCRLLYDASSGKVNLLKHPLVRKMAEFKPRTYLGDGWVVDYSDGAARYQGDPGHLFRFGCDVGSREVCDYAIYQLVDAESRKFNYPSLTSGGIASSLEVLRYQDEMTEYENTALAGAGGDWTALKKILVSEIKSVWYDKTQQCVMRKGKWTLAAKGGHNNESHNHNDVGSGILMYDSMPVFVDPGAGDYVKATFGKDRYTLWQNCSDWHNAPVINACGQATGREYAASLCECNLGKGLFRVEFAKAYPEEACAKVYDRTYSLTAKGLTITDKFSLSERKAPDAVNFILWGEPVVEAGLVKVTVRSYDDSRKEVINIKYPASLKAVVEQKAISESDKKMTSSWKGSLWRLSFVSASDAPLTGTYTFEFRNFLTR